MTFEEISKNIETPKPEYILDWREHTILYWLRLSEEIYTEVNLKATKALLLEELKMEDNPQHLEDLLEGLQSANLISINGNLINIVKGA